MSGLETQRSLSLHTNCWLTGHQSQFDRTELLFKSPSWNVRLTRESLEIVVMQGTINKEYVVKLSIAWHPVYDLLTSQVYNESGKATASQRTHEDKNAKPSPTDVN